MLPYDAPALEALLGAYNRGWWPAHALALVLGAGALLLAVRPARAAGRACAALLVLGWLWTGVVFAAGHYASLNWAGWFYGALFVAQALAMTGWGVLRAWRPVPADIDRPGWPGPVLAVFALLPGPALDWAMTGRVEAVRVVGLLPDATAVFTLGVLLAVRGAPRRLLLVPALWCGWSALWWWQLGAPARALLPLLGLAVALPAAWRGRRGARR